MPRGSPGATLRIRRLSRRQVIHYRSASAIRTLLHEYLAERELLAAAQAAEEEEEVEEEEEEEAVVAAAAAHAEAPTTPRLRV